MAVSQLSLFVSYSRTNSSFVDRLEADLQARNFHTWVDRRKLEGGQVWMDELEKAIKQSQVVLVVLSPEAVQSQYVRMEYRYAHSLNKMIVPLEYQNCVEVPIDLNSLQWVNFTQSYDEGLGDLLIALSPIKIADITTPTALSQMQEVSLATQPPETDLVAPQPALPQPEPGLMELYKAGVVARAANDLERAAVLWQQLLSRDPQFQSGILASQLQKLQQELHPLRIKRLLERAEKARAQGEWSQAIGSWQALLALAPENYIAKNWLPFAEERLKYAWMYESAVQFAEEQELAAAKTQLEGLWQEDPNYGDPLGLGKKVGASYPPRFIEHRYLFQESPYQPQPAYPDPAIPRLEQSYSGFISGIRIMATKSIFRITSIYQNNRFISGSITLGKQEFNFTGSITGSIAGYDTSNYNISFQSYEKLTGTFESAYEFEGTINPDGRLKGTYQGQGKKGIWDVQSDLMQQQPTLKIDKE